MVIKRNASRQFWENRSACDARKVRKPTQRLRLRRPLGLIHPRPPQYGDAVFRTELLRFSAQNTVPPFRASQLCPFFMSWNGRGRPLFSSRGTGGFHQGTIRCGSGCFHAKPGNFYQERVRRGSATVSRPVYKSLGKERGGVWGGEGSLSSEEVPSPLPKFTKY